MGILETEIFISGKWITGISGGGLKAVRDQS